MAKSEKKKKSAGKRNQAKKWGIGFLRFKPVEAMILACVLLIGIAAITYYLVPFTRNEVVYNDVPYETKYIDDANVEVGQQQTRQEGENGTKEMTYKIKHTLAGKQLSRKLATEKTTKDAVNKTVAKGTKKYQFMWCSNGSYRYYSNDEFKNPNTGFTHQSPDYCAQNGAGHNTGLADTAPAPAPTTVYQRSTPTTTHCYDTGYYSSSFSCYSY